MKTLVRKKGLGSTRPFFYAFPSQQRGGLLFAFSQSDPWSAFKKELTSINKQKTLQE